MTDNTKEREALKAALIGYNPSCFYETEDFWGLVASTIGNAETNLLQAMWMARASQSSAPAWIAVSERLPEPDTTTLWYHPSGNYSVFEMDKDDEGKECAFTHWMPLPAPPALLPEAK